MSVSTLTRPDGSFDDFEFAAIVAGFHAQPLAGLKPTTQPHGEPLPPADGSLRRREHRPARRDEKQSAILRSQRGEAS